MNGLVERFEGLMLLGLSPAAIALCPASEKQEFEVDDKGVQASAAQFQIQRYPRNCREY